MEDLDTGVVHPARRYNYWLGGTDNFAADRESGDLLARAYPAARVAARANRAFLRRAVRFLAAEGGVRQFLDIGTGLPTVDNTHEVAQRVDPASRIVYADNDPLVTAHAQSLLTSAPEGRTSYLEGDPRHPELILGAADILDFSRPVGLILVAVVHFLPDHEEAGRIVRTLVDALPGGSYLVMSCATTDFLTPVLTENGDRSLRTGNQMFIRGAAANSRVLRRAGPGRSGRCRGGGLAAGYGGAAGGGGRVDLRGRGVKGRIGRRPRSPAGRRPPRR